MFRIRNFLPLAAVLVGAGVLSVPASARADFEVFVYDDNSLAFTSTGSGPLENIFVSYVGTSPHFSLSSGSATSNFPGDDPTTVSLAGNETIATNFGIAGGTHTVTIVVSENGFLLPGGTPVVLGIAGGGSTVLQSGSSVTATYQAFLDGSPGNTIYPGGATFTTPSGSSDAKQTVTLTGPFISPPGQFTYTPAKDTSVVAGGTPFTLTTVQTYAFTVAAGTIHADTANASDSSTVTSVPAPAGLALLLTGLPFLGIGQWLRRRRQAA